MTVTKRAPLQGHGGGPPDAGSQSSALFPALILDSACVLAALVGREIDSSFSMITPNLWTGATLAIRVGISGEEDHVVSQRGSIGAG
jgi:hypothetical protein